MLNIDFKSFSAKQKYTLFGILFGLSFPTISIIAFILLHDIPFSLSSLIFAHTSSSPFLFVIDSAPLFLGLFAYFAGAKEEMRQKIDFQRIEAEIKLKNGEAEFENDIMNRVSELAIKQKYFKNQNINIVKNEIDLSEIVREFEDKIDQLENKKGELRKQNVQLVRNSIDLSDIMRKLEDKNYELENNRSELRKQNIKLVRNSIDLSEIMREFEDKNYLLAASQEELKGTLTALSESENKYRLLADNQVDVIWTRDLEMNVTYISPSIITQSGFTVAERMQQQLNESMTQESTVLVSKILSEELGFEKQGIVNPGRSRTFELDMFRKDGSTYPIEIKVSFLRNSDGEAIGFMGISRDISERKQAEAALRESEKLFRTIVTNSVPIIFRFDQNGIIQLSEGKMLSSVGLEPGEVVGQSVFELYKEFPEIISGFRKVLAGEAFERVITLGGLFFELFCSPIKDTNGNIIGVIGMSLDITKRKLAVEENRKLEARFQEAQKKESLSILAGGIAHDFNNLLTGILGNASLVSMQLSELSAYRKPIEEIKKASMRAADLTNQMLAYSGKGHFNIITFDLSELVDEMMSLVNSSISKKARIKINLDRNLPGMKGDSTQIRQLIMNMILNASDALEENDGFIAIMTGVKTLDESEIKSLQNGQNIEAGDHVYFSVEDNGCGMEKEILSKIFDPFFSTKFTGRGLGLAATLGIIEGHNGALGISSSQGEGTKFSVFFPATSPHVEETVVDDENIIVEQGNGTILVVDDEHTSRTFIKDTLEFAGHRILTASDGKMGVDVFRKSAEQISMVVLDYKMPYLNGDEAFEEMKKIDPNVLVVLTSGYTEEVAKEKFEGKGLTGFIKKPFEPRLLIKTVNDILH